MTNCVFLDASFWVAYRDSNQVNHAVARQTLMDLFRSRTVFVVTLPVVCEIHAAFSRARNGREVVLRDLFNNALVTIEDIARQDQKAALELLRLNQDKTYSLCDALSFAVMRRLKIQRALSFDKHFRQFGEVEVIPENFS